MTHENFTSQVFGKPSSPQVGNLPSNRSTGRQSFGGSSTNISAPGCGKDLAELLERDGQVELRFYQVKCGDIKKKDWPVCRDQLEEMFLVRIPSLQLPAKHTHTIGVLVCNGHANPYAEPVIDAWIRDQLQTYGRHIEFWHLDRLVDWIVQNKLVNELKLALAEQGVAIQEAV